MAAARNVSPSSWADLFGATRPKPRGSLRAVSVPITDATGVAGLVQPKSRVDVIFTRPGRMDEASTSTILQNVQVLSTGRMAPSGLSPQAAAAEARAPRAQVVTLLLTPDQEATLVSLGYID